MASYDHRPVTNSRESGLDFALVGNEATVVDCEWVWLQENYLQEFAHSSFSAFCLFLVAQISRLTRMYGLLAFQDMVVTVYFLALRCLLLCIIVVDEPLWEVSIFSTRMHPHPQPSCPPPPPSHCQTCPVLHPSVTLEQVRSMTSTLTVQRSALGKMT